MSKELEAFVRLNRSTKRYKGRKEDLDIVFTTIKTYEMEHTLRIRLENIVYELAREKRENEKKLKALEIIKVKKVNVEWLLETENVEEYNESLYDNLTHEEYDILKEVL